MRGSEASGPGAIFGAPSTLTTSVIRNPTSFLSSSTPLPSTDADVIAQNVEHVLLSLTSHNDGGLVGVSGNSSGSTGKGILIGVLSAFGSATVAVLVLAIFFFFKYTRRGRIFLIALGDRVNLTMSRRLRARRRRPWRLWMIWRGRNI